MELRHILGIFYTYWSIELVGRNEGEILLVEMKTKKIL